LLQVLFVLLTLAKIAHLLGYYIASIAIQKAVMQALSGEPHLLPMLISWGKIGENVLGSLHGNPC